MKSVMKRFPYFFVILRKHDLGFFDDFVNAVALISLTPSKQP